MHNGTQNVSTSDSRPSIKSVVSKTPVEELSFIRREDDGMMNWWVTDNLPDSDDWHDHYDIGRLRAQELLDFIRGENFDPEWGDTILADIASHIAQKAPQLNDGVYIGFFDAISEVLTTGGLKRCVIPTPKS